MGQPIPAQHPSVVLRSHFKLVRGLLALAMVAVLALTAAVVILANDNDREPRHEVRGCRRSRPAQTPAGHALRRRSRGGHARSGRSAERSPPSTRFDGGPEEGTRGPQSY